MSASTQLGFFEIRRQVERFMKNSGIRRYCQEICLGRCCGSYCRNCFEQEGRRLYCSLFLCSGLGGLLWKCCTEFNQYERLRKAYIDAEFELRSAVGERFTDINHLAATRPPMVVFKLLTLPEELVLQGVSAALLDQVKVVTDRLIENRVDVLSFTQCRVVAEALGRPDEY